MEWLADRVWPFEAKLTGDDVYLGARASGSPRCCWRRRTTFVDMYWHADRVAEAVLESGTRGPLSCARPLSIRTTKRSSGGPSVWSNAMPGRTGGALGVRIAPHAPYTCSPESVRKASIPYVKNTAWASHVHLSETRSETETIRQRYDKTSAEYLRDLGVFDYPTLAVHRVAPDRGGYGHPGPLRGVSVASDPQSNMKLASGIAPVARMIGRGLTVGIGTDGPCSNNDLDMWDEMRTASLLQKVATGDASALPAYETLRMATVGGACAVGMEGELGVVAPGARADLILVDMGGTHWAPGNDPIAGLVYNAKSTDVDTGACRREDSGRARRADRDRYDRAGAGGGAPRRADREAVKAVEKACCRRRFRFMYFAPIVCFIVPVFEFPVSPYEIASVGRNFAVVDMDRIRNL